MCDVLVNLDFLKEEQENKVKSRSLIHTTVHRETKLYSLSLDIYQQAKVLVIGS